MRIYTFDKALADSLVLFLLAHVDEETRIASPVVSFYDPMSIDDANRTIVRVDNGSTLAVTAANWVADVSIVIKSQWQQPSLEFDIQSHYERANEVFDKLFFEGMADSLDEVALGIGIEFVQPERQFRTQIFQQGIVTSELTFKVCGHFKETD